jgi:hypothetical protein
MVVQVEPIELDFHGIISDFEYRLNAWKKSASTEVTFGFFINICATFRKIAIIKLGYISAG